MECQCPPHFMSWFSVPVFGQKVVPPAPGAFLARLPAFNPSWSRLPSAGSFRRSGQNAGEGGVS